MNITFHNNPKVRRPRSDAGSPNYTGSNWQGVGKMESAPPVTGATGSRGSVDPQFFQYWARMRRLTPTFRYPPRPLTDYSTVTSE